MSGHAPELLEALELARSIIGHPDDAHTKMIDAAIAKAKGGSMNYTDKIAQARARFGKSFACDPGSTFKFRRDKTILDDWQDSLREQRASAQANVPDMLREQAA